MSQANATATVTETIKQEDGKFVLYSKDGSKVLGRFDSKDAAAKHEQRVQGFKAAAGKEALGAAGLALVNGGIALCEGGRFQLHEAYMSGISDDDLRAMRERFVSEKIKLQQKLDEMPSSQRYSSPKASQVNHDCYYYSDLIRMIEIEMQNRMLAL